MDDKLHIDGYKFIPNILDNYDLYNFKKSIINNKLLNYIILKDFIDNNLIPKINDFLKWDIRYMKFRFSSSKSSNLKDAANFHGDLYNFTNKNIIPIYTLLCNLDKSTLEVIPKTHLKNSVTHINSRKKIVLYPGDVLIFHSNLHHRGIPSKNKRRLLQVFEIFPNIETFSLYKEKILIVITNKFILVNLLNSLNICIKSFSDKLGILDRLHYWSVKKNLQYKLIGLDISDSEKENRIIGYLPEIMKSFSSDNDRDTWNINISNIPHNTIEPTSKLNYIIIVILVFILYKMYKKNILTIKL